MLHFGYTIIYVADVEATLDFYERAFGLKRGFTSENGLYGELETGTTKLSFVSESFVESQGASFTKNDKNKAAAGFEIALVTDQVAQAYEKACAEGALPIHGPVQQHWGQLVAKVRDLNGVIVEICSPMG